MAFEPERSCLENQQTSGRDSLLERSRAPCLWHARTATRGVFEWQQPTCWRTWSPRQLRLDAPPAEPGSPCYLAAATSRLNSSRVLRADGAQSASFIQ